MSYDVCIGEFNSNQTYNLSKLFYAYIFDEKGNSIGIKGLHDKTGAEAFLLLQKAFDLIDNAMYDGHSECEVGLPKFCAKYDPPNGWGSTIGGLVFMSRFMAACAANPELKVSVS